MRNSDYEEEYNDVEEYDNILEELPKKRIRRKKEEIQTTEYVNKEEMWTELYDYYMSLGDDYDWVEQKVKNKEVFPPISKKLTTIIDDIAKKMGYRANFRTYSWLDEMIGDAVLKMVKAVRDCSFKCYTIAKIVRRDNSNSVVEYTDKRGQNQVKIIEETDEFFNIDNIPYIKFKANPFGYFSRITSHSYLNRIKKENELEHAKRAFQEETWERLYADERFQNVRRPKHIDYDENDGIFDE